MVKPQTISKELIQVTKLLINNLTINDFDFRDFENPSLQKFYSHLQAHALNEKDVVFRPDLLEPDVEGFNSFKDVFDLVRETVALDCQG
jgi:ATP-dependent DNA helicase 2 subunit 1